jgi:YjjG family noncanonical pyrimidine nucleotidase
MYKNIFFDLDHTLWDYETNSKEALYDIHASFRLNDRGVVFDKFHSCFREVNIQLWDLYDTGKITSDVIRTERFKQILKTFEIGDDMLALNLSDHYLNICPDKSNLMPHTLDVLNYLSAKYKLTIVTNGFEEIQHRKLKAGNVGHFFNHIITSQKSGYRKPAKEIFEFALAVNNILPNEAIMIGDNLLTDIAGARNAFIDTVFYNPDNIVHNDEVKHEIKNLNELCSIL